MGWGGWEGFQGPGRSKCREHRNETDPAWTLKDIPFWGGRQIKSLRERVWVRLDLEGRPRAPQTGKGLDWLGFSFPGLGGEGAQKGSSDPEGLPRGQILPRRHGRHGLGGIGHVVSPSAAPGEEKPRPKGRKVKPGTRQRGIAGGERGPRRAHAQRLSRGGGDLSWRRVIHSYPRMGEFTIFHLKSYLVF